MIDVEETCQDHNSLDYVPGMPTEIIQTGYCLINTSTLQIEQSGCFYVKPVRSKVNSFCTQLTGITPRQASKGMTFHAMCRNLERKLGSRRFAWCGWGEEYISFQRDCAYHLTPYPFNSTFIDLSTWFQFTYDQPINCGLDHAMKYMNLEFIGRRHDGRADAINQARILIKMISQSRYRNT